MTVFEPPTRADPAPRAAGWRAQRALRVVERNAVLMAHYWPAHVARLVEPFLFLVTLGLGVGALVADVPGPGGDPIPYRSFVAPALLATSAMNAAVSHCSIDFFAKFKWVRSYDSMLATPISVTDIVRGELLTALGLVAAQAVSFVLALLVMGLVESWWAVLLVPASLVVGYASGAAGLVAASFLRSWLDFDKVALVLVPLFLFSASFFPLERYPGPVAAVVQATPLYHGVDLARDLTLGTVDGWSLLSVVYLVVLGRVCLAVADRRLARMLAP